jgi:site-specific recombinase XerD
MTQLRQQMIRAMELKNLSNNTQRAYLAAVTGLAKHCQQSPAKITDEMIEDYLLYLKNDKGNAPNSCGSVLTGLRFFYNNVARKQISVDYSLSKKPRKLPTVLTMEQVWKLIDATDNLSCPCCNKGKMQLLAQIPSYRARAPNNLAAVAA